jgi:hypothetical protein
MGKMAKYKMKKDEMVISQPVLTQTQENIIDIFYIIAQPNCP